MSKKKLSDGVTYHNDGGTLVVDMAVDDNRVLRLLVEDAGAIMAALLRDGDVVKTETLDTIEWADRLEPEPEARP